MSSILRINQITSRTGINTLDFTGNGFSYITDVGFGTTNPTSKLHVEGTALITGVATFRDDVNIGVGGTTAFFDVSTGRFGLGTNQPVGQVYIAGPNSSNFGVAADAALNIAATGGSLANRIVNLNFAVVPSATNAVAAIGMAYQSQSGFGNGSLIFGTRSVTTDTAPTERMRITNAGLVGIGTNNPGDELDIQNNGPSFVNIKNNTDSGRLVLGSNTSANQITSRDSGNGARALQIFTGTTTTAGINIDTNGRVGINSSIPTSRLDVVGDVKITGIITATSFSGDGSGLSGVSGYNELDNALFG